MGVEIDSGTEFMLAEYGVRRGIEMVARDENITPVILKDNLKFFMPYSLLMKEVMDQRLMRLNAQNGNVNPQYRENVTRGVSMLRQAIELGGYGAK